MLFFLGPIVIGVYALCVSEVLNTWFERNDHE